MVQQLDFPALSRTNARPAVGDSDRPGAPVTLWRYAALLKCLHDRGVDAATGGAVGARARSWPEHPTSTSWLRRPAASRPKPRCSTAGSSRSRRLRIGITPRFSAISGMTKRAAGSAMCTSTPGWCWGAHCSELATSLGSLPARAGQVVRSAADADARPGQRGGVADRSGGRGNAAHRPRHGPPPCRHPAEVRGRSCPSGGAVGPGGGEGAHPRAARRAVR